MPAGIYHPTTQTNLIYTHLKRTRVNAPRVFTYSYSYSSKFQKFRMYSYGDVTARPICVWDKRFETSCASEEARTFVLLRIMKYANAREDGK